MTTTKIEYITTEQINGLKFYKLIYVLGRKDYVAGIFGALMHYGVERTAENFKEMQKAIMKFIQYYYSEIENNGDIEFEYPDEVYENLTIYNPIK